MIDRDKIIRAFECISPSEELVGQILSENFPRYRKKSFRRIAVTVLCVCLAAVIGTITVAAATGIIDFKELFGKHIDLDNDELGSQLMAQATDVVYTVSDDDYQVSLKGITGDIGSLYAIIEITRVDGTPVTEHFLNTLDDTANVKWLYDYCDASYWIGGYEGIINDKGNLEFFLDIQNYFGTLDGMTISAGEENLVLANEFERYCEEIDAVYGEYPDLYGTPTMGWWRDPTRGMSRDEVHEYEDHMLKKYGFAVGMEPLSDEELDKIDVSSFMLLPLTWKISFTYHAPEISSVKLVCESQEEKAIFYDEYGETEITVMRIEIGAAGGMVNYEYRIEPNREKMFIKPFSEGNEICLIMSDGSSVPMLISSANGSYNGGDSATGTLRLYFAGESDNTVRYIDVSKGRTIYINGVEYKIKQQY